MIRRTLAAVGRAAARPVIRVIERREPALAAAAAGVVLELVAHYGLDLSASTQAWLTAAIIGALGWVTRQAVVALADLDDAHPKKRRKRHATTSRR